MSPAYRLVRKVGWLLRLRLESKPGLPWRIAIALLALVIRVHGWTLRITVNDRAGYLKGRIERPVIFLFWHNRMFSMPSAWQRHGPRDRKAFVLTSASPEGSLLALFMAHFGMGAVRGSTSRGGAMALRGMVTQIERGHDIIITPDGPRGPRYRLQAGALSLAQRTGSPILPLQIEYSNYRRLRSWDGFAIALPFSRMTVTVEEPFWVMAGPESEELEVERQRLERIMTDSMLMDRPGSAA
ncbi:MAG: lysophospholipid acyltransferase family protein [Chthoniobacterales bacterium]